MHLAPNKPAAPNAGIASQLTIEHHCPGVGEPERWVRDGMRRVLLPLLVAVGVVCTSCRTPLASASADYSDISEALFRHLAQPAPVSDPDSHGVNLAHKVYFLQVESRDPSQSFLSRLADFSVPLKGFSSGVMTNGFWVDRATGQQGVVFSINDVQMIGRAKAEADGAISAGMMRASGFRYYLVKKAGTWTVVKRKLRWVS